MILLLRTVVFVVVLPLTSAHVLGQTVEARIASVSGRVSISGNSRASSVATRNELLTPGDVIDTHGGGRVRIELSDGSVVIVQSDTRLVLQDYRSVTSLRELLNVIVGRVRIKINHFGSQPNPYRVNSPSASIAVRGTEFRITVGTAGDTEVVVYEGLVEVSSLSNPKNRVLVGPGHGVIVRPNEDIHSFLPGPNNEIGARVRGRDEPDRENDDPQSESSSDEAAGNSLRTAAGAYERYFQSIVESGETPLPARFAAFPDSHFDSLENPAFATEFTTTEGRFFVLPSMGGTQEKEGARELLGLGDSRLVDYSLAPQASLFVPLPRYRLVLGGRVASSRDGLQSFTLDDNVRLAGPVFAPGTSGNRTMDGSTKNELFTTSFVAARRFGSNGRTSLGLGLDYLTTKGSLLNTTIQVDPTGLTSRERVETRSLVNRTRFTLGLTRELIGGQKLGLFYRYGLVSAEDRDRSRTLNGENRLLNRTDASGRSSELGLRFRGSFTRRLFYGLEGSYFFSNTDGRTRRARVVDSNAFARSTRATLGFGLGYVIRPRTVLSFDLAGGAARIDDKRSERSTGNLLEDEKKKAFFLSLHGAVQADVWRRLFVSGSVLSVSQTRITDLTLYPDRFGRRVGSDGIFKPDGQTRDRFTDYFSNFGAGWRFTPNFLAEYIFSTDFGQTSPRHTLLLRYIFTPGGKEASK